MAITELNVAGYRSIRNIRLKLHQLNVLVGANGCGKSNLYQSMYLLAAAANGRLSHALADEGGMPSAMWAGPRRKQEQARVSLGATLGDVEYEIQCGLPASRSGFAISGYESGARPTHIPTLFMLDPEVKAESVYFVERRKRLPLLDRDHDTVWARDAEGKRVAYPFALATSESLLSQLREPHRFPHLSALRQEILSWRFYHHFRTDADAPLRHPQVGVRTPVLGHDGRDLAAAIQTIKETGDWPAFEEALEEAFPGAKIEIKAPNARFSVELRMPGINRPFEARELSDGTLRYLCLLAALLSPRPPAVLALNEPETSLHPDLLAPLATLIVRASRDAQLWITTHSDTLARAIEHQAHGALIRLEKINGETRVAGERLIDDDD